MNVVVAKELILTDLLLDVCQGLAQVVADQILHYSVNIVSLEYLDALPNNHVQTVLVSGDHCLGRPCDSYGVELQQKDCV